VMRGCIEVLLQRIRVARVKCAAQPLRLSYPGTTKGAGLYELALATPFKRLLSGSLRTLDHLACTLRETMRGCDLGVGLLSCPETRLSLCLRLIGKIFHSIATFRIFLFMHRECSLAWRSGATSFPKLLRPEGDKCIQKFGWRLTMRGVLSGS
jgi:hypothetical protein